MLICIDSAICDPSAVVAAEPVFQVAPSS